MTSVERLVDELRRAWDGPAWHGPSLGEALADVTAGEALARPLPHAHTVWELVLHLTAWTTEVRRRTLGARPAAPAEGDWPAAPPVPNDGGGDAGPSWARSREALAAAHRALCDAAATLDDQALDRWVGEGRDAPLGSGQPLHTMLHGVSQHHAYHAGQIALLKKAARGG